MILPPKNFEQVVDYAAYAGIGSRDTPPEIQKLMTGIATMLDEKGYTLRSGGAGGADEAFYSGTNTMSHPEIYVPWDGFNGRVCRMGISQGRFSEAAEIARRFHPNWAACSDAARKLHARNSFQILGRTLQTPCQFVICWTSNGKEKGGTGQAMRIATHYKVPIYNLFFEEVRTVFYHQLDWTH